MEIGMEFHVANCTELRCFLYVFTSLTPCTWTESKHPRNKPKERHLRSDVSWQLISQNGIRQYSVTQSHPQLDWPSNQHMFNWRLLVKLMHVWTVFVKPVVQPVVQQPLFVQQGCQTVFVKPVWRTPFDNRVERTDCSFNRLSNPFDNRFDNLLYRVYKHSTGCQTGLTTGWMFVYMIQPVVKPVVSCKRGLRICRPLNCIYWLDDNTEVAPS